TVHGFCADLLKEATGEPLKIMDQHFATALLAQVIHDDLIHLLNDNQTDAVRLVAEFGFRRTKELLFFAFDESYNLTRWINRREKEWEDDLTEPLLSLFGLIQARYRQEKEKGNLLDFSDLEEKAIQLLETDSKKRESYQKRFHALMIDEFQDTNPVQIRLLELLHDPLENRLFAVGDPKQSIYQFRGANVALFQATQEKIKKDRGELLFLRDNFRSSPSLITPLNEFFKPLFPAEVFQPMIPRKTEDTTGVTVISLPEIKSAEERRTVEAREVAQRIKEFRDQKREYREIVCLFRTRTAITLYEKVFAEYQIPCHNVSRGPLFGAQEVLDVVNLLKWIADPEDLLSLVGVLRSPFFGLSDEEIFLKINNGTLSSGLEELRDLRQKNQMKPPTTLLLDLMGQPFFTKIFRSAQEIANVERLIALAESFESLGVENLKQFLKIVEALREAGTRIPEASLFAPSANCVRLMTIHASKGLEFPIVFLADLSYRPITESRLFLFQPENGFGFKHLSDESEGLKDHFDKSPEYEKMEEEKKKQEKEESLRLLYVAMTRAQEELILPLTSSE
ncbi:MAG: 3'-5' exonuclease, partial [Deltaproteobacteria bacterium]|nr:3'-5' exonuclease [Deltaproteobacteria bacterium]